MHIDKFKQYLDEGYEIIEETQVNDFKCYVFEKKFDSIVDQLKNEMMSKRIEETNKIYQDSFTNQNITYKEKFDPGAYDRDRLYYDNSGQISYKSEKRQPINTNNLFPSLRNAYEYNPSIHVRQDTNSYHTLTDEELGRSNACKIKLSEMMSKLINDRKEKL